MTTNYTLVVGINPAVGGLAVQVVPEGTDPATWMEGLRAAGGEGTDIRWEIRKVSADSERHAVAMAANAAQKEMGDVGQISQEEYEKAAGEAEEVAAEPDPPPPAPGQEPEAEPDAPA